MADYTTEEIQEAVEKVVRSSVRRSYGLLGNRDTKTSFNDLQEAVAGLLTLNPNSPFYIVYLGTRRLSDLLQPMENTLVSLIEAVQNTDRRVSEVDNLAPLQNARVALAALEAAAASRTRTFDSVEDVPAFRRYDANLQRFLDDSSSNIRKNGAIVPTPEEARESIPGLVTTLEEQHAEIMSRAQYASVAIDDYDSLQLPSLMASGVISRSREVLAERINELEVLAPEDRLQKIRDVTLDILAGRAAVKGMGSLKSTTTFALLEGTGQVFADSSHPAEVATAEADIAGPYPIIPLANELYFRMDGSFVFTALAPSSYLAVAQCSLPEPYNIPASTDLILYTELGGTIVIPLTSGAARTAQQVVSDINGYLGGSGLISEVAYGTSKFIGVVDINDNLGPGADFVLPAPGVWETLRVQVGDLVRVQDPTSANDGNEYTVTSISGDTLVTTGAGPTTNETLKEIEVGVGKVVRVRIDDGYEIAALQERRSITIVEDVNNTAVPILGFVQGGVYRCRSTSAQQVAEQMNTALTAQQLGVPRLSAEAVLVPDLHDGLGRSDPDDASKIVAYRYRGYGDTAGGSAAPFTVTFDVAGAQTAGVAPGDIVVVRETPIIDEVNVKGVVTSVDDTQVVAEMEADITAATDILVEVGEDFTTDYYQDLEISNSASQDGVYSMADDGHGDIPFEFTIEGSLPLHRALGGLPQFFSLRIGQSTVRFSSTSQLLDTKVELDEAWGSYSAVDRFFAGGSVAEVGETGYFQLPEDPKSLSEGDSLELYEMAYNAPTSAYELTDLELDQLLVQISPLLPTDYGTVEMSNSAPIPFARIRLLRKNNYTVMEEALLEWLGLYQNSEAWFVELSRLLNPLIVNKNPTIAAVNAAKLHLQLMLGTLTEAGAASTGQPVSGALEAVLAAYDVREEDDVDTLVSAYLDRGSGRGIDILLQGRFTDFFGLSLEGMSYAGRVQELIREVSREDLPVRRTGRADNADLEQLEGSWEDTDYTFDDSDVDNFDEEVEIPSEFSTVPSTGL